MKKNFDILVVDDEQVVIDAILKISSLENFRVDTALDINEAINKLHINEYKLIICDVMMPDIDGFQFLHLLLQKKIASPVIMTTGYSTVENAVKSLYEGAIDFIPKPFTADEMLNAILRGMKYTEIQKVIESCKRRGDNEAMIYVTCPAKYSRLGFSSWTLIEHTGTALIGITDLFIKIINSIDRIELFKIDDELIQGNTAALIIDERGLTHPVLSPVTGRIVELNELLSSEPAIIEKDPFFSGWLYRVIPTNVDYELKNLVPCSSDRL